MKFLAFSSALVLGMSLMSQCAVAADSSPEHDDRKWLTKSSDKLVVAHGEPMGPKEGISLDDWAAQAAQTAQTLKPKKDTSNYAKSNTIGVWKNGVWDYIDVSSPTDASVTECEIEVDLSVTVDETEENPDINQGIISGGKSLFFYHKSLKFLEDDLASIESLFKKAQCPILTSNAFKEGLPYTTAEDLTHIEEAFDKSYVLSDQVKAFLATLYRYDFSVSMQVFPACLFDDDKTSAIVDETNDARKRGLLRYLLPFANENGDYWCFKRTSNGDEMKISLYAFYYASGTEDITPNEHLTIQQWIKSNASSVV